MPALQPAYELYLYRLLKEQLGVNRQVSLSRIDEALEADGLAASDFGALDSRQLTEMVPDFIKLTVFKKGVVFVTVIENKPFEQTLSASEKNNETGKAIVSNKPWKRKRGAKGIKPIKPKHIAKTEDVARAQDATEAEDVARTKAAKDPAKDEDRENSDAFIAELIEAVKEATATESAMESEPESEFELVSEPAAGPESEPVSQPTQSDTAQRKPSISLTITYDPSDADTRSETKRISAADIAAGDLIKDFENDVHIDNDLMGTLYQIAPMGANVLQLLAEDFFLASASRDLNVAGGIITFPTRYRLPHHTEPIEAALKRTPKAQRPWKLTAISVLLSELETLAIDPFGGLPHAGIAPWDKLPSQKGHPAPDFLRVLTNERAIADWKALVDEVSSHIALEADDFTSRPLALQQATIAAAYAYRKAQKQLTGTHEDFYLPVRRSPATETIRFDPERSWASSPSFERIIREKNLDADTLFTDAKTAGACGYRTLVELYNPSLDIVCAALPVKSEHAPHAHGAIEKVLVFETPQAPQAPQTSQSPYVAITLLSAPEAYALARIFSAGLPSWLAA